MTNETKRFDVLLSEGENKKLKQVATAYPTPKGAGWRFTLKTALPEGAQIVVLPSKPRPQSTPTTGDAA